MDKKVKQYIDKQESPRKEILIRIRKLIQKLAPQAEEAMSYGAPSFRLKGGLVMYAAFREHIGFYPEPAVIKAFKKELSGYATAKGTIRFPLTKTIPYGLIGKIIKYKIKNN